MFGKLLKYEFRNILRLFLPLWAALLVLSVLNRIFLHAEAMTDFLNGIPAAILQIVYAVALIAIPIVAVVFLIRRFYVGLLRDEGYLMFTLPVTTPQLIWSKFLSAVILTILTTIVSVISLGILVWTSDFRDLLNSVFRFFFYISDTDINLSFILTRVILIGIVSVFFDSCCTILQAYLSMSLGQLCKEHRILASVGFFFGINILLSILGNVALVNMFGSNADQLLNDIFENGTTVSGSLNTLCLILLLYLLITTAFKIAVFYFPTNAILKKKLNLE